MCQRTSTGQPATFAMPGKIFGKKYIATFFYMNVTNARSKFFFVNIFCHFLLFKFEALNKA